MAIKFITGNKNKLAEAKSIFGDSNVELLKLNLPEIQELDARKVIEAKLLEALKNNRGEFIVEDTSLCIETLNGFPGPLIKWFLDSIGIEGISNLVAKYENKKATARCIIGYAKQEENSDNLELDFFEETVSGTIVPPRGNRVFGWDKIFKPNGHDKTFAEMTAEEKNKISHRKLAFSKLNEKLKLK